MDDILKKYNKSGISRNEEASFPEFQDHLSAIHWLNKKYGAEKFVMTDIIDDNFGKVYCYDYILDKETYTKGKDLLLRNKIMSGKESMKYMLSSQRIEISENGDIHIIH